MPLPGDKPPANGQANGAAAGLEKEMAGMSVSVPVGV
jgi:hypothetical protein